MGSKGLPIYTFFLVDQIEFFNSIHQVNYDGYLSFIDEFVYEGP